MRLAQQSSSTHAVLPGLHCQACTASPLTSVTTRFLPPSWSSTAGSSLKQKKCWWLVAATPGATSTPLSGLPSPWYCTLVLRMPVSFISMLMVPSWYRYQYMAYS